MIWHVKCHGIVNNKCYGWHSVGIMDVELRVKLGPKGQIGDLSAPRESRKPGSQSEWPLPWSHLWEKGSSQSEGDLAGCAPRPPGEGASLDTGEQAPG